jgi:hypothetical protein
LKRYCPSHYRGWLLNAHKSMSTADIFAHLINKARPIHGAEHDSNSKRRRLVAVDASEEGPEPPQAPRQTSAASKRKSALTRVISKNNRQRRLGTK